MALRQSVLLQAQSFAPYFVENREREVELQGTRLYVLELRVSLAIRIVL
jgi:hypothetical protein